MKTVFALAALLVSPAALRAQVPVPASSAAPGAVEKSNKALMLQAYAAFNARDWSALDAVIAKDMVDHQAPPGSTSGLAALNAYFKAVTRAFPDYAIRVDDVFASGEEAVARLTLTGTQKEDWMGVKASGRRFSITAIDIVRFKDGKCVEHWGLEDDEGMLRQLAAPAPDHLEPSGNPPGREPSKK